MPATIYRIFPSIAGAPSRRARRCPPESLPRSAAPASCWQPLLRRIGRFSNVAPSDVGLLIHVITPRLRDRAEHAPAPPVRAGVFERVCVMLARGLRQALAQAAR